jgi:hypothetical protein
MSIDPGAHGAPRSSTRWRLAEGDMAGAGVVDDPARRLAHRVERREHLGHCARALKLHRVLVHPAVECADRAGAHHTLGEVHSVTQPIFVLGAARRSAAQKTTGPVSSLSRPFA